jgi:signal transduction histidine kinase
MPMSADAKPTPGILLVDDTVENLRVLAGMLTGHGFDVRPVTSGRDALNAVAHALPDLILLDVMMPEMNGFDVCLKLRAAPETRDIPVIFLTALDEVDHKVRGFSVGGSDYITKPFQMEEVLSRVQNQLALQTARRELANNFQRLQELERMRDDLVHMVVHDMRSPLAALTMTLDLLKTLVEGEAIEVLQDASHIANTLINMANGLLDVSRLEEGRMPLHRARCDLSRLVVRTCTEMQALEPERRLVPRATEPVTVMCDQALIARVLSNLVGNAMKHTPRGGEITIEVTKTARGARASIQDQGNGVPAELRPRLFEKFAAVTFRDDRRVHSAGLGLAFCKLAVEAHGGTIGVESGAGSGCTFWFELPR